METDQSLTRSHGARVQFFYPEPGASYQVQFSLSRNPENLAADRSDAFVYVEIWDEVQNSENAYDEFTIPAGADRGSFNMEWQVQTLSFQATSNMASVNFYLNSPGLIGGMVDAVSVVKTADGEGCCWLCKIGRSESVFVMQRQTPCL